MTDTHDDEADTHDQEDRAIARALGLEAAPGELDAAVAEYERVLAEMPFDEIAPAPDLEDRIVAAALERRPAAARAIDGGRAHAARRTASRRWMAAGATATAAAAIVLVLALGRSSTGPSTPGARIAPAAATASVKRVLAEPGTRTGVLRNDAGATVGRVALGSDGQGYLYELRSVRSPNARWLWLDTTAAPLRVGSMPAAETVHFVVNGGVDAVSGVFLTSETAPGIPRVPGEVSSRAALR